MENPIGHISNTAVTIVFVGVLLIIIAWLVYKLEKISSEYKAEKSVVEKIRLIDAELEELRNRMRNEHTKNSTDLFKVKLMLLELDR